MSEDPRALLGRLMFSDATKIPDTLLQTIIDTRRALEFLELCYARMLATPREPTVESLPAPPKEKRKRGRPAAARPNGGGAERAKALFPEEPSPAREAGKPTDWA